MIQRGIYSTYIQEDGIIALHTYKCVESDSQDVVFVLNIRIPVRSSQLNDSIWAMLDVSLSIILFWSPKLTNLLSLQQPFLLAEI